MLPGAPSGLPPDFSRLFPQKPRISPLKLYIMRHGPAEDEAPSGQDFDRALTASGRERVRNVARELLRCSQAPLIILSSPLVRALQTAEIVAQHAEVARPLQVRREMAPGGRARDLVYELARSQAASVMVVGHEPDVSSLAAGLLPAGFDRPFEKAMVVAIEADECKAFAQSFVLEPRGLVWS